MSSPVEHGLCDTTPVPTEFLNNKNHHPSHQIADKILSFPLLKENSTPLSFNPLPHPIWSDLLSTAFDILNFVYTW
jgi:hypothetical protein